MATIQIKHLGPIRDTGFIQLTELMLVIGRQSSGKSTFMKVLCYCRWLEKHLMTSSGKMDETLRAYSSKRRIQKELKQFHHIDETYFNANSYVHYDGDLVVVTLKGTTAKAEISIKQSEWERRYNTKLSYIPAERNLISAVRNINSAYKTRDRDAIFNFISEWNEAKEHYDKAHPVELSLTDDFKYYSDEEEDYVLLPSGKVITSFYASSGVQSVMPIDIMSHYVLQSVGRVMKYSREDLLNTLIESFGKAVDDGTALQPLTEEQLNQLREKMVYQSGQLFIEEPEQNLYPDAQRVLVQQLVRRLKSVREKGKRDSMIVMTTHSPYVLSTLNVLMADADAMAQRPEDAGLKEVVDADTLLSLEAYSAYFINQEGVFVDIKDQEIPIFSGIDLDSVSDWVEEHLTRINDILYANEDGQE